MVHFRLENSIDRVEYKILTGSLSKKRAEPSAQMMVHDCGLHKIIIGPSRESREIVGSAHT